MDFIGQKTTRALLIFLLAFNVWVWWAIVGAFFGRGAETAVYFLDVGQGDSELITFPGAPGELPVEILVDGGRDKKVLHALEEVLGDSTDKYIDIVMLTHPDLDHYGGLIELLKRYEVGLFVSNGIDADGPAFQALEEELVAQKIPTIILGEGDVIRFRDSGFFIISPDRHLKESATRNEAGIVAMLVANSGVGEGRALFMADVGISTEDALLAKGYNLKADILKVGHHGSKNSSGDNFIAAVSPFVAGIGVGKNTYGHPTPRVLETLELVGARVVTTQKDGTVKIALDKDFVSREENAFSENSALSWSAMLGKIMTGNYKNEGILAFSLPHLKRETKQESRLVSYKKCSFANARNTTTHSPLIFSEIAWMGDVESHANEWIKLRNVSGAPVLLSGWQVINANERIRFMFPQGKVLEGEDLTIARKGAEKAGIKADFLFTGAIKNRDEGLRLFDNACRLIDEAFASPNWPAGDNKTKQTMERMNNLSWQNSTSPHGTPGE